MRFCIMIMAAVCTAFAPISIAQGRRAPDISWGKPGISLEEYARDAAQCAQTSRYVTTYIAPKTLRQLDALSSAELLETVMNLGVSNSMDIVSAITKLHSEDDVARRTNTFSAKYVAMVSFDVRDQLQAVIDKCLLERGYTPLRLTRAQTQSLSKYRKHSSDRTTYLHSIDSDPKVVDGQRVTYDEISAR